MDKKTIFGIGMLGAIPVWLIIEIINVVIKWLQSLK